MADSGILGLYSAEKMSRFLDKGILDLKIYCSRFQVEQDFALKYIISVDTADSDDWTSDENLEIKVIHNHNIATRKDMNRCFTFLFTIIGKPHMKTSK